MTGSVDGLVSGLSTSSLIAQLMQVEAAPQTRLKTKVSDEQKVLSAYQSINTKFANLETAADTVRASKTWKTAKATSSDSAVTATPGTAAATGTLTFDVTKLARAQVSTVAMPAVGPAISGSDLTFTFGDGTTATVTPTDTSPQGIADAINSKGLSVKASVVNASSGSVLQLSSTKTGAANSFDVTGLVNAPVAVFTASDAEIQFGDGNPANGGYKVTSSTNSFTGLMSGVTINVNKVQTGVTVSVTSDADAIASQVQAMVDAANAALTEVGRQSAFTTSSTGTNSTGAALAGSYTARQMSDKILSTVGNGFTGGSFKQVGVQLTRDGKLTFDKAAFLAAYAADPAAAQQGATALGDGLKSVSDEDQKVLTSLTQSSNSLISNLNDQISNWDIRLQTRQAALQKQFSGLEVALGKLKDQSNWLAGQIASLPSGG